jgi:hypothetical protein
MEGAHDVTAAVARLSPEQRRLVAACLDAVVRGPYIDHDGEFHTVMGVSRAEAADVAASWPEPAANGWTFAAVNNALLNLLGYPHGRWRRLSGEIGAGEREVAQALACWRGEGDPPDRYIDALM